LGGYIAAQVAIENKDLIEKLVLIDSSGKLDGPTQLLNEYLYAAQELNLIIRYEKIQRVFENIYIYTHLIRVCFLWLLIHLIA
jgi:pimeloyl-ACP methyl ester carboxylesterase